MGKNKETVCWICGDISAITDAISRSYEVKTCDTCIDSINSDPIQPERLSEETSDEYDSNSETPLILEVMEKIRELIEDAIV